MQALLCNTNTCLFPTQKRYCERSGQLSPVCHPARLRLLTKGCVVKQGCLFVSLWQSRFLGARDPPPASGSAGDKYTSRNVHTFSTLWRNPFFGFEVEPFFLHFFFPLRERRARWNPLIRFTVSPHFTLSQYGAFSPISWYVDRELCTYGDITLCCNYQRYHISNGIVMALCSGDGR